MPPPTPVPTPFILGPAHRFRIEGRSLCLGPKSDEMAVYRNKLWYFAGKTFTLLESEGPTFVRFEDEAVWRTSEYGPFTAVRIVEGRVSHGPGFGTVLAAFDEGSECWQVRVSGERYSDVVLTPGGGRTIPEKGSRTIPIASIWKGRLN